MLGIWGREPSADTAAPIPTKTLTFQSFGAHFCEVEIDPRIQVSRIVSVIDVGRVLNPKTGRSQILQQHHDGKSDGPDGADCV